MSMSRSSPSATLAVEKRSCSISSPPSAAASPRASRLDHDVEVGALGAEQQVADGAADQVDVPARRRRRAARPLPGRDSRRSGSVRGVDFAVLRPLEGTYLACAAALMEKAKDIVNELWANHKPVLVLVALAGVIAVAGAIAIYLERQPPDDVSNADAEFVETEHAEADRSGSPTGRPTARTTRAPDTSRPRTSRLRSRSSGASTAASSSSTRRSSSAARSTASTTTARPSRSRRASGKMRWRKRDREPQRLLARLQRRAALHRQPGAGPGPGARRQERQALVEARAAGPDRVLAGRRRRHGDRRLRVRDPLRVRHGDRQDRLGGRPRRRDQGRARGQRGRRLRRRLQRQLLRGPHRRRLGQVDLRRRPATSTGPPRSPSAASTSAPRTAASTASRRRAATSPGATRSAARSTPVRSRPTRPTPSPPSTSASSAAARSTRSTPRTGDERWSADSGGSVIGAASLIGETVYVANLETTETFGLRRRDRRQGLDLPRRRLQPGDLRRQPDLPHRQEADLRAEAGARPAAHRRRRRARRRRAARRRAQEEVVRPARRA